MSKFKEGGPAPESEESVPERVFENLEQIVSHIESGEAAEEVLNVAYKELTNLRNVLGLTRRYEEKEDGIIQNKALEERARKAEDILLDLAKRLDDIKKSAE